MSEQGAAGEPLYVEPGRIVQFADALRSFQGHVLKGCEYSGRHTELSWSEEGLLATSLRFGHESALEKLNASLKHLAELFESSAHGIAEAAAYYQSTDVHAATGLDGQIGVVRP